MTSKVRLSRLVIHLEVFADNGEDLVPIPLDPVKIHNKELANWYAVTLPDELAKLEAQLNDSDEITPESSDLAAHLADELAQAEGE